jgi:hypothetical protein
MVLKEGKFTLETFAQAYGLSRQSALNRLSMLKRHCRMEVTGGGTQKRIYTIYRLPRARPNGFYTVVNKYSPEKLQPKFDHYVHGRYTVERAVIDGIRIGDVRTLEATQYLFRHVTNWKRLFHQAEKEGVTDKVIALYKQARARTLTKRMPARYLP